MAGDTSRRGTMYNVVFTCDPTGNGSVRTLFTVASYFANPVAGFQKKTFLVSEKAVSSGRGTTKNCPFEEMNMLQIVQTRCPKLPRSPDFRQCIDDMLESSQVGAACVKHSSKETEIEICIHLFISIFVLSGKMAPFL
jgi:hypothetical protein